MKLSHEEQRFRDAVAGGESVDAALRRLKVPKRLVAYFTKRLPKAKETPAAVTTKLAPLSRFIVPPLPKQEQELQPEEKELDGDVPR